MKNKTLQWLYAVPGRKKAYILFLTVIQILNGSSGVLYALLLRNIVDSAVNRQQDGFVLNITLIVLLVIAQLSLRALIRYLNELCKSAFENIFKERLMKCLLKKDYAAIEAVHSGEWLNRLTNDTVVVANGYAEILPGLAGMVVKMVSAVIMIIILQPWFTWVILPGGAVMVLLTYAFRKVLKRLHKNVQEKDGSLRVFLQETLGNMMMIRSFAAEQQIEEETHRKAEDHKKARMRKNRFSNFCNIGFGTAIQGMYLFGVIWCGWGILNGFVSYGTLTAVTQLISQIQSPFANITGYLPKFYAMTASAERLMEIESFAEELQEEPLPLTKVMEFYQDMRYLSAEKISYTYYPPTEKVTGLSKQGMPVVLKDLGVKIHKGEYVAFTGHSGCGKSTVIKLLMGIYRPDGGECRLETKDGSTLPLTAYYRRLFAYVPQGNKLMTGTVREAVAFSDLEKMHDDERIFRALRIACADEFVSELDDGADTLLGERGTGLSEGQMQRIAIARAVFSDRPILILDEATSSLDAATERLLLRRLRELTDKTVLIVTHRPAALSICDRILRFTENGIEELTKETLMKS